ncbi:MAG: chitobiase/beta-hexosaminidase C-terminal domain-containing protein [Rhodospirillales bacterium]|nr:chitobiase/beta-hexosaminidase C-terminal domain-containing protein [Rhodospirillales bacterium]
MPLVVHFKRPAGWGPTVNIHFWDALPAEPPTTWPGVPMRAEANDWLIYTFATAQAASIVFNDGAGRQSGNQRRDSDGWFYTDSRWYAQNPERPVVPVVTATPAPRTYGSAREVTLGSSNRDDVIHFTADGSTPSTVSGRYETPIAVARTTTIRALAINSEGVAGAVASFAYTIDPSLDEVPPTIAASVAEGSYVEPISVVLTITDDRPAVTAAYFTTDGSEPTPASSVYVRGDASRGLAGPAITVDRPTRLKVLAVDAAGNEARADFGWNIGPIMPTGDFREETIYFLITTRFYDGDPSNNFFCRDRIKFNAAGQPEDPHWRGDFKGLIQRLDYIRDLGFTAIWITPPVENRSGLDYHGYHAYDWNRVDPRLESPDATYQDLINEAHRRGIKIIQDVVINHSCQYGIRGVVHIDHLPIKYYVPQGAQQGQQNNGPYQGTLGNYAWPNRDDIDNPVAPDWYRERHARDPEGVEPLVDPLTGATVPSPGYNPGRFFGVDAGTLDPNWYHQDGFIMGGDWESAWPLQQKHIAGDCIDLATERQNVKDYLIDAVNRYLDMGVDAIRLDTVKHVERGNLLEYVNAWKAHKPGVFVFGENLVKGYGWGDMGGGDNGPSPIRPWWYTRLGNDPRDPNSGGDSGFAVLDFGLFSSFRDNVSRGHYQGIAQAMSMDWIYGDPTTLITFLQNHDVGPDNDFRDRFRGEDWMAAAAYNVLWTVRGIPCLSYGEEIAFMRGAPQDVVGANDTLDSTGRAYFGDHITDERIGQTQAHPLYRHIKRLNQVRQAVPALQKGRTDHFSEWGSGMSFVRDWNNGESYAVVGLAIGSDQGANVGGIRNGRYVDAITGGVIDVGNGSISFGVRAGSAGIWVLNGPGKIGEDGEWLR